MGKEIKKRLEKLENFKFGQKVMNDSLSERINNLTLLLKNELNDQDQYDRDRESIIDDRFDDLKDALRYFHSLIPKPRESVLKRFLGWFKRLDRDDSFINVMSYFVLPVFGTIAVGFLILLIKILLGYE